MSKHVFHFVFFFIVFRLTRILKFRKLCSTLLSCHTRVRWDYFLLIFSITLLFSHWALKKHRTIIVSFLMWARAYRHYVAAAFFIRYMLTNCATNKIVYWCQTRANECNTLRKRKIAVIRWLENCKLHTRWRHIQRKHIPPIFEEMVFITSKNHSKIAHPSNGSSLLSGPFHAIHDFSRSLSMQTVLR